MTCERRWRDVLERQSGRAAGRRAEENQPPVPLTHATFASGTCRSPASPRSCFTASTMRNMPAHARVAGREPAAVGVGGQRAADAELAVLDERAALAAAAEPERLERQQHHRRERVVDLADVDVGRGDAGPLERELARSGRRGTR